MVAGPSSPGYDIPVPVLRGLRDKKVTRSVWYNWGKKKKSLKELLKAVCYVLPLCCVPKDLAALT